MNRKRIAVPTGLLAGALVGLMIGGLCVTLVESVLATVLGPGVTPAGYGWIVAALAVGGAIGLGVSEAAYMAEIARAGILSVDDGQREAARSLGMSNAQAMRRIVLPQAMRVIVPPTGNETIAMTKDTSLLIGIPVTAELFFQLQTIGSRLFETFNVLVAATLWYLVICSVLMVGQYFLERHFGRGYGDTSEGGARRRVLQMGSTK